LAGENAQAYLPDVAMTLNNLAILYSATQRLGEAEAAYDEALRIRRELAGENAQAYLPDVAMTLNNLAFLYCKMQRTDDGLRVCEEAQAVLEPFWRASVEAHGNLLAKIVWTRILLLEQRGAADIELCSLARQGLAITYEAGTKTLFQEFIGKYCR
jgi:tetratricopeptide (TPR) repeat protein